MIRIIALSSIYLLMLFALVAGIESLTGNHCSDWLKSCSDAEVATLRLSDDDDRLDLPESPEHR